MSCFQSCLSSSLTSQQSVFAKQQQWLQTIHKLNGMFYGETVATSSRGNINKTVWTETILSINQIDQTNFTAHIQGIAICSFMRSQYICLLDGWIHGDQIKLNKTNYLNNQFVNSIDWQAKIQLGKNEVAIQLYYTRQQNEQPNSRIREKRHGWLKKIH